MWDKRVSFGERFYVQGFTHLEVPEALAYACSVWPEVVARQKYPLVLVP